MRHARSISVQAHFTPDNVAPVQAAVLWSDLPVESNQLRVQAQGKGEVSTCVQYKGIWTTMTQ